MSSLDCNAGASDPFGAGEKRREFIGLMGAVALSAARPASAQNNTDLPLVGGLVPGGAEFYKDGIVRAASRVKRRQPVPDGG